MELMMCIYLLCRDMNKDMIEMDYPEWYSQHSIVYELPDGSFFTYDNNTTWKGFCVTPTK